MASPEQLTLDSPWIRPGLGPVVDRIKAKQHRVLISESPGFHGTLRGYQHDGVAVLYLTRRLLLGDVTGAGKTVQSLRYLQLLKDRGELTRDRPAVVGVPPNALDTSWMADGFDIFNDPRHGLRVVPLSGDVTPADRRRVYATRYPEVILVTFNTLMRDWEHLVRAYDGFSTFIWDEGSVFKNHSTKTASVVKQLGALAPRTVVLTATPVQTQLLDLHSILEALQLGRIFGSAHAFDRRYVNRVLVTRRISGGRVVRQWERNRALPYSHLDELRALLRPYYFRRNYNDIDSDMPELSFSNHWLDMAPRQAQAYDQLRRKELPPTGGVGNQGRRFQLQQRARYLKELATSYQTFDPNAPDLSPQLDWLCDRITGDWSSGGWDGNPVKVVVYSSAKLTILTLMRRLDALGVGAVVMAGPGDAPGGVPFPFGLSPSQREPLRQRFFNDPNCRVLVGTSAIEMSLNFPVSPVMVNLDLPTNPARLTQLAGRIWRSNSRYRFVHVINLLSRHSVEAGILQVLAERQHLIDQMNGEPSQMFNSLSTEDLERIVSTAW